MRYDNLVFTDADRERLKENRDAINAWIMENVVPHLSNDERVIIDYGDEYRAPGAWDNTTTEYHFAVYGEDHKFYSGGGRTTHGYVGIGEKYGGLSDALQTVGSPYKLYPIIANWDLIKSHLLTEIKNREKCKNRIHEFTV